MCLQEEALEGVNYIRQSAHQVPSAAGTLPLLQYTCVSVSLLMGTGLLGNRTWLQEHH